MNPSQQLLEFFHSLNGQVIALIYSFENEDATGFKHYEFWKSEVIAAWLSAVEEIGCKPYILDVRTFMMKASMGTLPHLDFVLNLNAGNVSIDNLCLVPSICRFLDIPCIPCSAKTCAVGEDKLFANYIAQTTGLLKIPKPHAYNVEGGIIRDRNLGSSIGIRRTSKKTVCSETEICQVFISGIDVTIPVLYNPLLKKLEVLPPVAYKHSYGESWFLDKEAKLKHNYQRTLLELTFEAENAVLDIVKKFDIQTYCRIDARIKNYKFEQNKKIELENLYFLEINPTPTINNKINFAFSLQNAKISLPHKQCLSLYNTIVTHASITGYILFCSILALKATHC